MAWMLACALAFIGLGAGLLGLQERLEVLRPSRAFWWGLVGAMPLTSLWHLAFPVDGRAWLLLAALALVGFGRHGRALGRGARETARRFPLSTAAFGLAWVALPWVGLQPLTCVDAGLYYLASVEWVHALPTLPGLQATNPVCVLHAGSFLLTALVGAGPFAHEGYHVLNPLLAWWGLPLGVAALEQLARRWTFGGVVVTLAVAPGVDALLSNRMNCPSADIGVAWLGVGLCAEVFGSRRPPLRGTLALLLLAPMFKLSLLSTALTLAGLHLWRGRRQLALREVLSGGALAVAAWLPFFTEKVITSGYPLYPSPLLRLDFDWTLPRPLVAHVNRLIRSYAEHDGIAGQATLLERSARLLLLNRGVLVPLAVALLGSLAAAWRALARAPRDLAVPWGLGLLWLGWAIWFAAAPDPRFAGALLWASGGVAVGLALLGGAPASTLTPSGPARALLAGLLALLVLGDVPFMTSPGPAPTARPERPRNVESDWVTLGDGTRIIDGTPREGRATCWSVPCASIYPPALQRRDPADLSKGFRLPPDATLPQVSVE